MDLLEKASVILTPTAYDNGKALCVKPSDGSGDFDFSRNSAATRVNAQGLVENVQILSSNLVQNGDFSEEGAEEVSNGSFTNGSTDWSLGTGWSIGEDKATFDETIGGAGNLNQGNILTVGKTYKLTFDTLETNGGNLAYAFGNNSVFINNIQADTNHVVYGVADDVFLKIRGAGDFIGSITNISVKEVGMDWALGTGWSIGDDKAVANTTGDFVNLYQNSVFVVGKTYKTTFTIVDYTQGSVRLTQGGIDVSGFQNAVGTYTAYFTATQTSLYMQGYQSFIGSITNISVIEITDDTNLPRINYENFSFDGSGNIIPDSGCGSWLWEPQSTNLIPYSEDFSDASWIKNQTTITQNATISPSGLIDASMISEDNTNNFHRVRRAISPPVNSTLSIFAKKGTNDKFLLWSGASGVGFDLTLGTINNVSGLNPSLSSSIKDFGNGWYRCSITDNSVNSFGVYPLQDFSGFIYQGSSTNNFYIWGAQLEQQSYATSYIPTSGSQVTRNQDVCINGATGAGLINSTEGVLYAEIAALADDITSRKISLNTGTFSNQVTISFASGTSNTIRCIIYDGSSVVSNLSFSASNITLYNKIAISYKSGDTQLWVNGVKVGLSTSTFSGLNLTNLNFNSGSGEPFFGKTKCVAVFPILTDAELTELTTI